MIDAANPFMPTQQPGPQMQPMAAPAQGGPPQQAFGGIMPGGAPPEQLLNILHMLQQQHPGLVDQLLQRQRFMSITPDQIAAATPPPDMMNSRFFGGPPHMHPGGLPAQGAIPAAPVAPPAPAGVAQTPMLPQGWHERMAQGGFGAGGYPGLASRSQSMPGFGL